MKKKTSLTWLYFTEVDIDHAKCKICNKIYSRKGRTTTPLKFHLKSVHKEQFDELNKMIENQCGTAKLDTAKMLTLPLSQDVENHNFTTENNIKLEDPLDIQIWTSSHTTSTDIDRRVGEMIALQNLNCNFVEGTGFRRLMRAILPNYEFKDSRYFAGYVIDEIYAKITTKIENLLSQFTKLSFAVDIWSEPGVDVSLLCFTTYGITEDFRRMQFVLECCFIKSPHTSDVISEQYTMILQRCNVQNEKVHCFIQGDCNMSQEINSTNISSVRCTIHQLQLSVRAALEQQEIRNLINKCKDMAAHFVNSHTSQEELNKIQREQLNRFPLLVIEDSGSRWNSTYYMIKRLLELKDAVCLYSKKFSIPQICPEEWLHINKILAILSLFEEITITLSDASTSMSSVIPLIYALKEALGKEKEKADTTDDFYNLITKIIDDLSCRFISLENNNLFALATYLDPRFKLRFFSEIAQKNIEFELLRLLPLYHNIDSRGSTSSRSGDSSGPTACKKFKSDRSIVKDEPGVSRPTDNSASSIMSNLERILALDSDDDDNDSDADVTQIARWKHLIKSYSKDKRLPVTEDPLEWWKTNTKYKDFRPIVRAYLSPPPGVVPREKRCNEERDSNSLKTLFEREKSANLFFIKYNLPLLNYEY